MAEADEKITTARWRAIEKTLPCSADKADFRNKLEQIKRNKTPPKELAVQCEEAARQLDEHPSAADALRNRAANYRKISRAGGFPLLRKFSILWLWDAADGNLGVSTPRKRLPYGPVIAYFQAAAEFVFDKKPPGPEAIKKIVADYRRAGLKAAYHAALLHSAVFGVPFAVERQAQVTKDETKVFILRDGKLLDHKGNVVDSVG